MYKVLVTGANGQLGNEIRIASEHFNNFEFSFTDVDELDITDDSCVINYFKIHKPDLIINCAAYNAVDLAEKDFDTALLINEKAVENIATTARSQDAFLIHFSTDFVFEGLKKTPYIESDIPHPLSKYGLSKYRGEQAVQNISSRAVIIRTSWLYSQFGSNFVKTIIKHATNKDQLKVVSDQIGTPTYARDLARVTLKLIKHLGKINSTEIFHYSNEGTASWYDFAKAIVEMSGIDCKILPVTTKEYPLPAKRPQYSVMNKQKIKEFLSVEIPDWRDSLSTLIGSI